MPLNEFPRETNEGARRDRTRFSRFTQAQYVSALLDAGKGMRQAVFVDGTRRSCARRELYWTTFVLLTAATPVSVVVPVR
jgi:hypothetical protein